MNISHCPIRSPHCLNPAIIIFVLFAVFVHTLNFTPPLSPPSYTPSLTTATFCTTKYQINRLQHIQNALARTVVQAPKFQHDTPILKSLHWLKVSEWIEYKIISLTKFSIPLNHHISMTLYLVTHLVITNTWNVDVIKCVIRSSRSNNINGSHEVVNKILTVQIQTTSIYIVQE